MEYLVECLLGHMYTIGCLVENMLNVRWDTCIHSWVVIEIHVCTIVSLVGHTLLKLWEVCMEYYIIYVSGSVIGPVGHICTLMDIYSEVNCLRKCIYRAAADQSLHLHQLQRFLPTSDLAQNLRKCRDHGMADILKQSQLVLGIN